MQTLKLLILVVLSSLLMAACSSPAAPAATPLEFKSMGGTYRVNAPAGWKLSEPMMGFQSLMTNENDINALVMMVDPPAATLGTYTNPREMTAANGKTVTVYGQPAGFSMTSTVNGVTFNAADAVNVLVPIGEKSYLVGVTPATTRKLDDALLQQIVDMLATMEVVSAS